MTKLRKLLEKMDLNGWQLLFSLLFTLMLICGKHIVNMPAELTTLETTYMKDFHWFDGLLFLVLFPFVTIASSVIARGLRLLQGKVFIKENPRRWYLLLVFIVTLMILWVPYLMSYRPGGIYFDTVDSLDMAMNRKAMDNHNPVLYTLLWKLVFWMTGAFKGASEYEGLNLFTELQTLLVAITMSCFLYWCYRKGMKLRYVLAGLLFVGIYPLFPYYGISLWKDTIFSLVVFGFSLFLYQLFETYQTDISVKNMIVYGIFLVAVIFLRNNGIYVAFFTSLFVVVFCLRRRKKIAGKLGALSLVLLVISMVIQGPIYDKLGYNIDSKRESLGIPLQQVAYIIATDGDLSGVDLELLDSIMPIEEIRAKYDPVVVDNLKFDPSFNVEFFEENADEFLGEYLKLVRLNRGKAIKAYLLATIGFWDVFESSQTAYICNFHFMNADYFMSDYFDYYFDYSFHNLVNPTNYISAAIFAWLMLYSIFVSLSRRNYRGLVCILPTLGLWLTIMVATPLAFSFRYVYALFLCTPLYLFTIIKAQDSIDNTKKLW